MGKLPSNYFKANMCQKTFRKTKSLNSWVFFHCNTLSQQKYPKKMRKLHPSWGSLSIFLDWASISNYRHVFHTVRSNFSCFINIGWAPADRWRTFFSLNYIKPNKLFPDLDVRRRLLVLILHMGIIESYRFGPITSCYGNGPLW
jgi:hypothetical protein